MKGDNERRQENYATWKLLVPLFGVIFLVLMSFGGGYLGLAGSKIDKVEYQEEYRELRGIVMKNYDRNDAKFDLIVTELGNIRVLIEQRMPARR